MPDSTGSLPVDPTAKDPSLTINGSIWTMTIVAMIFLFIRLWIKVTRRCVLWWDDAVLVLSWATLAANSALMSVLLSLGFGTNLAFTARMTTLSGISGATSSFARVWSKTSFALTLLRVLEEKHHFQRSLIWFIIVSMHVFSLAQAIITYKRPCERAEDEREVVLPGPCMSIVTIGGLAISVVAYSGFMDFVLALFPWWIVWKLHMRVQEKIGMGIAMSLGILAGVFAILNITGTLALSGPGFTTYKLAMLSIVASAEPTVTIIAASIPVLRILLRDLYHKPTLVEVSTKGTSRAELRRTSTKLDRNTSTDETRGIVQKTEVEIEYRRKSSYGARDARAAGYELEDWDLGLRPMQPGRAK